MVAHEQALLTLDGTRQRRQASASAGFAGTRQRRQAAASAVHEQALLALDRDDKPLQYGRA